jgi:collagen triple helix repeat protein
LALHRQTIAACVITAMVVGGGTASATRFITGKDIADGSIRSRDIGRGQVGLDRLSPQVRFMLAEAGKPGKDGAPGAPGRPGAAGARGATGAHGADGGQGIKGDPGAKGDKGDTGVTGSKGDPGLRGLTGAAGPQGAAGKTGAKGDTGVKGDTGAQGPAGPQGVPGAPGSNGGLPANFFVTNKSVGLTASGVDFGPYADGGAAGGSLYYRGFNGHALSDIAELSYTGEYSTDDHDTVGVPYLRIFLNDDTSDVIFSPNTQPASVTSEDAFHTWNVTGGTVRYDDDTGNGAESSWADVVAAHGDEKISGIYVSAGFSAGANLHALVTGLSLNGNTFDFPG